MRYPVFVLYEIHWDPCLRIFDTYYSIYRHCVMDFGKKSLKLLVAQPNNQEAYPRSFCNATYFWLWGNINASKFVIVEKCKRYESISLDENAFYCVLSHYLMVNFLTVSLLFWNAVCKGPFSTQKDEFSHCCIEANENESRESWSIWSLFRKKYGYHIGVQPLLKGVFSKPSGDCIVAPIFCLLS